MADPDLVPTAAAWPGSGSSAAANCASFSAAGNAPSGAGNSICNHMPDCCGTPVVQPAVVLPSGHLRWDVADLRRQLTELRERGE